MIQDDQPFAVTALRMSAPILVWAAHFGTIYGYTGLACARRFHDSGAAWIAAVPWVIGIATIVATVLMVCLIAPALRAPRRPGFVEWISAAIAGLALIGVFYETIPVFMLPVCG